VLVALCAFLVSVLVTSGVVRALSGAGAPAADRDFSQPQKFHSVPVPRIGGLGVVLGIVASALPLAGLRGTSEAGLLLTLMACALPVFGAGFLQDFTEAVAPRWRLLAAVLSALLAYAVLGLAIRSTGLALLDGLVSLAAGSVLLTLLAVAGMANAINIIDGFHGLAATCVVLMLAALAWVGFQVDDALLVQLALAGIGAVAGFLLWNFPGGLIFLGDGGAYFLGFYVAELSLLLLTRHPGEVARLFPLLACLYPVVETLFSIYRRTFLRAALPSRADALHLHSLVYRRALRWAGADAAAQARRNAMTSVLLWGLCLLAVLPAALFWDRPALIVLAMAGFVAAYVTLYWRIVRFRSPRWMRALGRGPRPALLSGRRAG
jgi:UDP-N-acetylmuramyl pentapeptide phosphotransferase/UDP-N-acetylglucosamine-1-phosphate transferase